MDLKHLVSIKIVFFLLNLFSISFGQELCSAELTVSFEENNTINKLVTTITTEPGVSLSISINPEDAFGLEENRLVAVKVLDYETLPDGGGLQVSVICRKDGVASITKRIFVLVENINDNPPVFAQSQYTLTVNELSPTGTSVGKIEATDLDKDRLYYRLESPTGEFELLSNIDPEILVRKIIDYDTTPEVSLKLIVQDTPLSSTETPSHTATTTIIVSILDINNRPPWFQPCTESTVGTAKICLNTGYKGIVNLTEQATGSLPLEPGPVHAIDGDKGRNDINSYEIVEGNENGIFSIDLNSGVITMQKPADVQGPIILTVMAYESETPDQFATTTVILQVVIKSKHPPVFVKPSYKGFISEDADVVSLVMESKTSNKPLHVQATDADFSNGVNPNIRFEVTEGSDFKITPEGFILTTRALSPGNVELQIQAVDSMNGEFSTSALSVEVTPGVPTTTDMPTTTTEMATSTSIATNITSNPTTITSEYDTSASFYTDSLLKQSGDFRTEDMVALGLSLSLVLILCFVVIGLLAYNVKRYSTNWSKLSEASIFRSNLSGGSDGPRDGVQYTNEGFQNDSDSVNSKEAAELPLPSGLKSRKVPEITENQSSAVALQGNSNVRSTSSPTDSGSLNASDSEKEVKPILTKERRMEDGYKAVWFKEDIDPNDKEEKIIHDSGEQDTDRRNVNNYEDVEDYDENEEL